MVDIEYIRHLLFGAEDETRKIAPGDTITLEALGLLSQGKTAKIASCFVKTGKYDACAPKYHIEIKCLECGGVELKEFSKTSALDAISQIKEGSSQKRKQF